MYKSISIFVFSFFILFSCAGLNHLAPPQRPEPASKSEGIPISVNKFQFPPERNMLLAGKCAEEESGLNAKPANSEISFFPPKVLFAWSSGPDPEYRNSSAPHVSGIDVEPSVVLKEGFMPGSLMIGLHSGNFVSGRFSGNEYWLVYVRGPLIIGPGYSNVSQNYFRFAFNRKTKTLTSLPAISHIGLDVSEVFARTWVAGDGLQDQPIADYPDNAELIKIVGPYYLKRWDSQPSIKEGLEISKLASALVLRAIQKQFGQKLSISEDESYELREFLPPKKCLMAEGISLSIRSSVDDASNPELKIDDPLVKQEHWQLLTPGTTKPFFFLDSPKYGRLFGRGYRWSAVLPDGELIHYKWDPPVNIIFNFDENKAPVKMFDEYGDEIKERKYSCFMPAGKREADVPLTHSDFTNSPEDHEEFKSLIKIGTSELAGPIYKQTDASHLGKGYGNYLEIYHYALASEERSRPHEDGSSNDEKGNAPLLLEKRPIGSSLGPYTENEYGQMASYVNVMSPFGDFFECRDNFYFTDRWAEPLLYVYSANEKSFRVTLPKNIQIVATRPKAVERGWNIKTVTDGSLVLEETGLKVPYLFWEANVTRAGTPSEGFMVSASESFRFFNEKLRLLGLSERETGDFLEFWREHFDFSPYYYVSFLEPKEIEKRVPLQIFPKPQTIIRVEIAIQALSKPFEVQPQRLLPGPVRTGDTVVEWGVIPR